MVADRDDHRPDRGVDAVELEVDDLAALRLDVDVGAERLGQRPGPRAAGEHDRIRRERHPVEADRTVGRDGHRAALHRPAEPDHGRGEPGAQQPTVDACAPFDPQPVEVVAQRREALDQPGTGQALDLAHLR